MQHSPLQRTFRLVVFSIGFLLFIVMAVYAMENASDPRAVRGQPFLLKTPAVLAQLAGSSSIGDTALPVVAAAAAAQQVVSSHVSVHKVAPARASHAAHAKTAAAKPVPPAATKAAPEAAAAADATKKPDAKSQTPGATTNDHAAAQAQSNSDSPEPVADSSGS